MSLLPQHHKISFRYGEKTNYVYNWSNDFLLNIMHFYFQLVRPGHPVHELETQLVKLLQYTTTNNDRRENFVEAWILLYRLIGYTRDKKHGRGEYQLAYMQLFCWFHFYPHLAFFAFMQCVKFSKYGSWKDIKLFSNYIYQRTCDEHHPFIELMVDLLVKQLKEDEENYKKDKEISLAAKWTPREKSKYGWLFKKIAIKFSPHLFQNLKGFRKQAERKAYMILRRFLSKMNNYTHNTEMLMCNKGYHMIDFSKVSATTIHKNILAFQNIKNNNKARYAKWDRYIGAGKFRNFMERTEVIGGAAQIQVGNLVKSAIFCTLEEKAAVINKLWRSGRALGHKKYPLVPIIPLVDMGASLEENNHAPLFNAIGVGIRISERAPPPFTNRMMVFSASPQWLILDDLTFVEKATAIYKTLRGIKSNIEGALDMIKNILTSLEIPPKDIKHLTLCIISDMQFETFKRKKCWPPKKQAIYELIREKFTYNNPPCTLPKLVFYNVKQTPGMPLIFGEKNIYLMAGYNAKSLNMLTSHKKKTNKTLSSTILQELQHKRYFPLEYFLKKIIK